MKFFGNANVMTALTIIGFFTLIAFSRVGQMPDCEPIPAYTPWLIIAAMGIPFLLGYLGGKGR